MTPLEAATAAGPVVVGVGGKFMVWIPTLKRGPALGLPKGWEFYVIGRAGALGDVSPEAVAAVFAFQPAEVVMQRWRTAREIIDPLEAARAYAQACQDWGREHLAAAPNLDRLVALLGRVVHGAEVAGAPLFAAWRALPVPDDPPAAAAQLLHVLREHRGAMHVMAVVGVGLSPLEAVMAGGGEANAEFLGWPRPYPDPAPLVERHTEAQAHTNVLSAGPYALLTEPERAELVELLLAAKAAVPT